MSRGAAHDGLGVKATVAGQQAAYGREQCAGGRARRGRGGGPSGTRAAATEMYASCGAGDPAPSATLRTRRFEAPTETIVHHQVDDRVGSTI
jgi:hypothetical protein